MNELTTIARKADILFGLRPALEKFGFSPEEDIILVFGYEDREVKTEAIPSILKGKNSSLSLENIGAAVIDWLNKAEVQYGYSKFYREALCIEGDGEFKITLKIVSPSKEFVMKNCVWCCPCDIGYPDCCLK